MQAFKDKPHIRLRQEPRWYLREGIWNLALDCRVLVPMPGVGQSALRSDRVFVLIFAIQAQNAWNPQSVFYALVPDGILANLCLLEPKDRCPVRVKTDSV